MKGFYSLKTTECVVGKNISETPVDFNLDRPLTEEERLLTESYNRDDLEQTRDNFYAQFDDFALRLDNIKEFNPRICAVQFRRFGNGRVNPVHCARIHQYLRTETNPYIIKYNRPEFGVRIAKQP